MSVPNYSKQSKAFFDIKNPKYDFQHKEDCGKYTEEFVIYFRDVIGDKNIFHLRKYGAATQYNGHAIDAILYYDPERGTYQSVDLIGAAEGPDENASGTWTVQQVYYEAKDAYLIGDEPPIEPGNTVPWLAYDENSFQALKNQLAHDYARRPQNADFDVTVWAARVFHSAYMGPEKTPLGLTAAIAKHRPEWCAALGVSLD